MTTLQQIDMQATQCGFIGIGAMGFEMALRIHKQLASIGGKPLLIYNRTSSRAKALKERVPNIQIAESITAVAQEADVVFTSLVNDEVVTHVVSTLLNNKHNNGSKKNSIIVELSTVSPSVAQALANKAHNYGVHYIACPVTGPPTEASTGNLILIPAGDPGLLDTIILPLLTPAIGNKKVFRVGQEPHKALQFKSIINFFTWSLTETLATGIALAEMTGTGQDNIKILMHELFPGTVLSRFAERMARNTYRDQVYFPLTSAREDAIRILNLVDNKKIKQNGGQGSYRKDQLKLPAIEAFLNHVETVIKDHGDYDVSGIVVALLEEAGVQ